MVKVGIRIKAWNGLVIELNVSIGSMFNRHRNSARCTDCRVKSMWSRVMCKLHSGSFTEGKGWEALGGKRINRIFYIVMALSWAINHHLGPG